MGNKQIPIEVLDAGGSAYVSERKVYPRDVAGPLNRLRVAAVFWLLGMYYLFPWLSWDGRQAVLFDLPARKFHVFAITFWPQDFVFLAMLLMIAALVRLCLPADGVDRSVPVDGERHRRRPPQADQTGCRPVEPRQDPAQERQA